MPFRSVTASPEELAVLAAAFDVAWMQIDACQPVDPLAASGARERLGAIIVALWRADPDQDLVLPAVEQFLSGAVVIPPASMAPTPER